MKGFLEFIRTQGVVGLAVGFILGKAVSDVVASIVTDLVNPIIGIILGKFGNLSALSIHVLSANITYGKFISILINFAIIAFVVYFGVKKLGLDKLDKQKQ
jgi:large conductance mechanosensitive channel